RAKKPDQVDSVILEALETDGPVLVDIAIDPMEKVFPMMPAGAAHNEILFGPDDQISRDVDEDDVVLA
ncbi:MAG: acetolactate synthase 3 large subunit, partial [Rhodospirillales bacterium]|nr:acetolactate synthase 3 large subunit [Rhodospirillales bacterium]